MSTYDFEPDPDDFGPEPAHIAGIKTLQAKGKGPAPCARFCEATAFKIEIAGWKRDQAENLANQCKLVDQIAALTAERDALIEGWSAAKKLAMQNALERDVLKDAARMALDVLDMTTRCDDNCQCSRRLAIAALKAAL